MTNSPNNESNEAFENEQGFENEIDDAIKKHKESLDSEYQAFDEEKEQNEKPTEEPSEEPKKQKKKMKRWKKVLLIILCVFLSLIILIVGAFAYLYFSGKAKMLQNSADIKIPENIEAQVNDDDIISYKGHEYAYNKNVTTILCMGIDTNVKSTGPTAAAGTAGQADALYLVVMDTKTGKITTIAIPRDSMAEIEVYSKTGKYLGIEETQICLAYSYGDGKDKSCQNVSRAVSRLLLGMPVTSYFAVDYRSIPEIHKAVGNITVIPNETFKIHDNGDYIYFTKNKPFTLKSNVVFRYLQHRNAETLDAAYLRMERQIEYIKNYGKTAYQKTKANITFPVKLYNKISKNSISNLDASKITFLATCAVSNSSNVELDFVKLKGEYQVGNDKYAELYLDNEQIFETVLSLFYKKIN